MERKDRENAHSIKEKEINKMRIQMEEFKAECQEKLEAQLATLKKKSDVCTSYKLSYVYVHILNAFWY